MATTPAVTPIRATELLVFLMAKRRTAVSAISRGHFNRRFVNKFHNQIVRSMPQVGSMVQIFLRLVLGPKPVRAVQTKGPSRRAF